MEAQVVNTLNIILSGYIFVIGVNRMAVMGWWTHRRSWQLIYLALVCWAVGNAFLVCDGKGHIIPVIGLFATALWFHESRNRWRIGAPDYMRVDCTFDRMAFHDRRDSPPRRTP